MKLLRILTTILLATIMGACAHHDNVRTASNGEHYIKLASDTKEAAGEEAIRQSDHFCSEQDKKAYIIDESIEYVGSMPEEQYLTTVNVAKALRNAGGAMWGLGGGKVDDAGAAIALGGGVAAESMGQPYELEMNFTCR